MKETSVNRWEIEIPNLEECSRNMNNNQEIMTLNLTITNKYELVDRKDQGFSTRKCVFEIGQIQPGRRVGKDFSERRCRLEFDNNEKLPYFKLDSTNGIEYCLKDVAIVRKEDMEKEEKEEKFSSHKPILLKGTKSTWSPLFHENQMVDIDEQMQTITCPLEGCPVNDLRMTGLRSEKIYCMADMRCSNIKSMIPAESNNGILCMENTVGTFENYNYCCISGSYGPDMPQCYQDLEE